MQDDARFMERSRASSFGPLLTGIGDRFTHNLIQIQLTLSFSILSHPHVPTFFVLPFATVLTIVVGQLHSV